MRIFSRPEEQEANNFLLIAAKAARESLCLRGHCGAIIVKGGEIIGKGFNSPPQNNINYRTCLQEYEIPAGFRHDRTCCMHAEQRAIEDTRINGHITEGSVIYFTRLDENDNPVPSHRICCTICSRAVLDAGISEFVLAWEDGTIRSWPADEFNKLSYEHKTPIVRNDYENV